MPSFRAVTLAVLGALVLLVGVLAYLGNLSGLTAARAADAEARRYESFKLGDQMRQSSNDLTRMVRMYVATGGERRYRDCYDEILSIRNGQSPRPAQYDSSFWDRVLYRGKDGVAYGPPKSLRALMKENGITDREFAALDGSRQFSDRLAEIEREVMAQVERKLAASKSADTRPELTRLVDADYYRHKAQIMAALDHYLALVDQRTHAEINALRERSARLRLWQLITIGLILLQCLVALVTVTRLAVLPLRRLLRTAEHYRQGNYGERASVAGVREIEQLGAAFNQMAQAVQHDLERRERMQEDLRNAKDALAASNERFGRLADAVDVVFWMGEPDFSRWQYVNPAYERLWGWKVEELYRKPSLFLESVHPDDVNKVVWAMQRASAGGQSAVEYRVHSKDGRLHWLWSRAFGVKDAQGKVVCTTGTTTDITSRKDMEALLQRREREARVSEQRLRGLTDNGPSLLIEGRQDAPGQPIRFTYVSAGAERFFHPHKSEDLVRDVRLLLEAVHREDRKRVAADIERAERERLALFECEYRSRRPDGSYRWVRSMSTQVWGDDGTVLTYGVLTDVHEQKQLEEELGRAREQAEAANRAKSSFLATMSHEIRTPMIGVTGMLEILSSTRLNDDQLRAVAIIRQSAQSLLQIIGDILDFSKIEAGKLDLAPVTVSLARLVESVAVNFMPPASSKGLNLAYEVDPSLMSAHVADAVRIRQILGNFLSNALKFTHAGRIDVRVRVLDGNETGQRLEFSVRDTGIGISEENQKKLFQPFSQADAATTRRFGGSGLGLSICRRLAELMDGEIGMESQEGVGTTMFLRVALARGDPAKIEAAEDVVTQHRVAGRRLPTRKQAEAEGSLLLLVEDHPTNRQVLSQQFGLAGFVADIAVNGLQALRRWKKNRYAVVFTDLHMPEMDGIDLTRAIREAERNGKRKRTPVLALTAAVMKEETERCFEAGMDDVVTKPTTVAVLASKLRQWLPHLDWTPADSADAKGPDPKGPQERRTRRPDPSAYAAELDESVLQGLAAGDALAASTILDDFLRSTREDVQTLAPLMSARDADSIRRQAHRILGAARMVGALPLAHLAADLEAAGKCADWGSLESLLPRIRDSFDRLAHSTAQRSGRSSGE
jgi:PAS domain S-box-containing protein